MPLVLQSDRPKDEILLSSAVPHANPKDLAEPVLHRAAFEVRYADGIVYLDKCGSLTRDLQKVVGKGFTFEIPTVQDGRLTSAAERIAVRYGPDSLAVVQDAVENIARFTQISSWSWHTLGPALEVTRKVKRCGFRFQLLFASQSIDEAEHFLTWSGLVAETEPWKDVFGVATARQYSVKMPFDGWKSLRVQLGVLGMEVAGSLSSELEKFYPPSAVHLDLDFILAEGDAQEVRPNDIKEGIVRAWSTTQALGTKVRERCIR